MSLLISGKSRFIRLASLFFFCPTPSRTSSQNVKEEVNKLFNLYQVKQCQRDRAPLLPTVLSLLREDRAPTFRGLVPGRVRRSDVPDRTERRTDGRPGTSGGGNRIVRFAADHERVSAVAAYFLFRFAAECLVAVVFATYLFLSCGCSLLIHTTSKSAATSFISI